MAIIILRGLCPIFMSMSLKRNHCYPQPRQNPESLLQSYVHHHRLGNVIIIIWGPRKILNIFCHFISLCGNHHLLSRLRTRYLRHPRWWQNPEHHPTHFTIVIVKAQLELLTFCSAQLKNQTACTPLVPSQCRYYLYQP